MDEALGAGQTIEANQPSSQPTYAESMVDPGGSGTPAVTAGRSGVGLPLLARPDQPEQAGVGEAKVLESGETVESTSTSVDSRGSGTTTTSVPNAPSSTVTTRRGTSVGGSSLTTPSTGATTSVPSLPSAGEVVWEEHFSTLNTRRWVPEYSTYGDGNKELQCYVPDNVSVRNGKLVLRAKKERVRCADDSMRSYSSGMVRSRGLAFRPGQALEFRIKLTPGNSDDQSGLWPAVWSSSWAPGGWPKGGELDFIEVMTAVDPTRSVYSAHFANPRGQHELKNKTVRGSSNFSDSWHTVRFHYGAGGKLVWFLDGEKVAEIDRLNTIQGYPAPFDSTIREIKINLALGGTPGPLSDNAVSGGGALFEVDYIKVYNL